MTELEELQKKLEASEANNAQLVQSIGKLEKANSDLVSERSDLKQKLKENASDAELKAENEKLMKVIESQDAKFADMETAHKSELNTMKVKSMFDDLGIKADSQKAKDLIIPLLMEGADFDGDNFRYLDEDNTTLFKTDNVQYGLIDRVNELRESGYGGLFKPETGGGKEETPAPSSKKPDINAIIDRGLKY